MRTTVSKFIFLFLLLSNSIFAQSTLNNGLVMYLPFNGNANDATGNGNNGVVYGATLTADEDGIADQAYYFDGVDDFISISHNSSQLVNSFTLCAKVMPTGFYSGLCPTNTIIAKGNHQNYGHIGLAYSSQIGRSCTNPSSDTTQIFMDYLGDHYIDVRNTSGLSQQPFIIPNNWYCVVRSFDATTNNLRDYVNGVLYLDTMLSPALYYGNSYDSIVVGKLHSLAQYPYWLNGKIDEIRLYNRALEHEEIYTYCGGTGTEMGIEDESLGDKNSNIQSVLYPNPIGSTTKLSITLKTLEERLVLRLFNDLGQLLWSEDLRDVKQVDLEIPTNHLSTGHYSLLLSTSKENKTINFVKL